MCFDCMYNHRYIKYISVCRTFRFQIPVGSLSVLSVYFSLFIKAHEVCNVDVSELKNTVFFAYSYKLFDTLLYAKERQVKHKTLICFVINFKWEIVLLQKYYLKENAVTYSFVTWYTVLFSAINTLSCK